MPAIDTRWLKLVLEYSPSSMYNHTLFDYLKSGFMLERTSIYKLDTGCTLMDEVNCHVVLLVKICGKIYNFRAM